jgi:hypothetical protein
MPTPVDAGLPNPASYTAGVDTVQDNVTGLLWQRADSEITYTQEDAATYCSALSLDGLVGWRLPSLIELVSIVDFSHLQPSIDTAVFGGTYANWNYLSSSAYPNNPGSAYCLSFVRGDSFTDVSPASVRCVHGDIAAPPDHYSISSGIVRDNATKLEWQQVTPGQAMSWSSAVTYCQTLTLDGTGWRLPTVQELQTILDHASPSQGSMMADPTAFPLPEWLKGTLMNVAWSSTSTGGQYWLVSFLNGVTKQAPDMPGTTGVVRCVRPASSA